MDILGAAHIAASAAHAHIALAEAGIVVVELMHGLKAHTVARLGADIVTACHGAVVIQHAGRPHAAALAVTAGLIIDNVGGVEAAAGNAHGVAAAAANAVVIELTPHLKGVNVLHHSTVCDSGDIDLALILGDKCGGKVAGSLTAEHSGNYSPMEMISGGMATKYSSKREFWDYVFLFLKIAIVVAVVIVLAAVFFRIDSVTVTNETDFSAELQIPNGLSGVFELQTDKPLYVQTSQGQKQTYKPEGGMVRIMLPAGKIYIGTSGVEA